MLGAPCEDRIQNWYQHSFQETIKASSQLRGAETGAETIDNDPSLSVRLSS